MIPNYIGESLAAVVPSLLGLAQGLGQDLGCKNVTVHSNNNTSTILVPEHIVPNYSVSVYFLLMFVILCVSTLAFSLLNYTHTAKSQRKDSLCAESTSNANGETTKMTGGDVEVTLSASQKMIAQNDKNEKVILLSLIFCLSFICYGILPGLQSYSTLPYGNQVYNLAVKLSRDYFH